ncbi:izumo sperm-egg fusion protein 1 isoform X1 [Herpailurus yagouaroundi]|uniref:izumo sperm-egg fusion protein 1 isoform X1 n=1 Tax=Herpailurus yagouaroundi TaxID=1608482 RepID=UPI001AD6EA7A|nr:izumo sperm-egg fusion protein 1 isoform X1 [Puma yagouaroundi]
MGPQVALLVAALAGCLLPAGGCVICDQRVVAALDALEKEYLPTHMARERQRQVMETIRQTVRNFWDLPYLEDAFMGVIDEATMETSVLGFLRSMTLITNSDIAGKWQSGQGRGFGILWLWSQTAQVQTPALSSPGCVAFREGYHSFVTSKLGHNGACTQASDLAQWPAWLSGHSISLPLPEMAPTWNASLFRRVPVPPPGVGGRRGRTLSPCSFPDDTFVKEFSWMLTLEKAAFQRNVARFQREDFCPNKCGMMLQPLIWCSNCKKQLHVCRKSTDCGVRQINVHETEDLILDCELDWHKLSQGLTYYSFYRVWGSNSETLVSEGKRPTLIKRLVRPEDAGIYRCELGTERSGPATVTHFEVTVLPKRVIEEIPKSKPGTQYQRFRSLKPSECLNPKDVLRGFLFEMLIWGFVFLILGFATSVLCFRSGTLIDSVKSWVRTDKAAAPEDQGPQSRLSQTQLSQSQVSQTQLPKVPNEEKATAPRLK